MRKVEEIALSLKKRETALPQRGIAGATAPVFEELRRLLTLVSLVITWALRTLGKLVALETAAQVSQTPVSLGFGEDGAQALSTPSAFLKHGVKG